MKTKKSLLVACFVGLALTFGIAGAAMADLAPATGIVGSKHDMNKWAADDYGRVCAFCHTPHHAVKDIDSLDGVTERYAPLWSRELTAMDYETDGYYSETLEMDTVSGDVLVGPSRLCMGCHDGVVAIDAYYGSAGTETLVGGDAFPSEASSGTLSSIGVAAGSGLTNDHPIGFVYDDVAATDVEIKPSSSVFGSKGVKVSDVLYNGYMTCATCHDVHNSKLTVDNSDDNSGWFLYGPQTGSAFCLTCHDK